MQYKSQQSKSQSLSIIQNMVVESAGIVAQASAEAAKNLTELTALTRSLPKTERDD
jgi:hypothetical protein